MKRLIFFAVSAFISLVFVEAQTVKVDKVYRLTEQKGFYPQFNSDGSMLAFSSPSYKGLEVYKFTDKSTIKISDEDGAGLDPVFSNDNKRIFYKKVSYKTKLRKESIESYSFANKTKEQVVQPKRNVKRPQAFQDGVIVATDNQTIKSTTKQTNVKTVNYVWSDGRNLNIYRNDKIHVINPVEGANGYIWASLSPNSRMILFTAVGRGTFVCDLGGGIIVSLGYLNAPVWYGNDFVVGMYDKDDGENITESRIVMKNISGKMEKNLTPSNVIAVNPTAASTAGKIAYNTDNGDIYVMELTLTK